jgi:hypothetical protein
MSFAEIGALIGTELPASARDWSSAWWDNDHSPNNRHSQSKHGWLAAGWMVESRDPDRETVTFCREATDSARLTGSGSVAADRIR